MHEDCIRGLGTKPETEGVLFFVQTIDQIVLDQILTAEIQYWGL